jgi:hypothetical protein
VIVVNEVLLILILNIVDVRHGNGGERMMIVREEVLLNLIFVKNVGLN